MRFGERCRFEVDGFNGGISFTSSVLSSRDIDGNEGIFILLRVFDTDWGGKGNTGVPEVRLDASIIESFCCWFPGFVIKGDESEVFFISSEILVIVSDGVVNDNIKFINYLKRRLD